MNTVKSVLVIDNDTYIRDIIEDILHFEGYEVYKSICGKSGLESIRILIPDLVICNMNLQEKCGVELYKKVSQEKDLQNIPFIFMSGIHTTTDIHKMLGRNDFPCLQKPFSIHDLLDLVKEKLSCL